MRRKNEGVSMKTDFLINVVSILNMPSTTDEKIAELRKKKTHTKGSNQIVLSVIIELLSEYSLPLRIDDHFSIYSMDDITSKEYDALLAVVKLSSFRFFNAICFDMLWEHCHKIDFANKALEAYFEVLQTESNNYTQTAIVSSICRIYAKIKSSKFNIAEFHQFCLETLIPNYPDTESYTEIALRSLLLGTNNPVVEEYTVNLIKSKAENHDYYSAIHLTEILAEVYNKEKRTVDKQSLLVHLAKYYEAAANQLDWNDPQHSRRIIHLIQKAMNLWSASRSPNTTIERKRLAKRIEPVKKLSLDNIKSITSGSFDLTDAINEMRFITENSSFEKCIWNFIHAVHLISPQNSKKQNSRNRSFFSLLFETTILDSDGRIKCIIPSSHNASPDDRQHILEHDAEQDYSVCADAFISRYLYIIKERFSFTEENLKFIVDNNAFIPEDRKNSFLKGLTAGFEYDYITALSILMPQVENAIRKLASECGAVVYKTKDNGVEECLSLESILALPEIEKRIDPIYLFNFKVFYTSEYGFGMRNIVGHGLASDAELSSCQGLIVWWFTLRMCCIYSPELVKRISEQSTD